MEIYLNNFAGYISVTLEQPVVIRVDTRISFKKIGDDDINLEEFGIYYRRR